MRKHLPAALTDAWLQTDPTNAPFQKDMDNWAAISNRTYIWNYVTSFGSYIQPFPNWYVLGPNIKYFADHGVRGIFEEGSYGTSGGDMDMLKDYVMGRMLWNVTLNPDDVISEFLTGYFGPAAPFIRYVERLLGALLRARLSSVVSRLSSLERTRTVQPSDH